MTGGRLRLWGLKRRAANIILGRNGQILGVCPPTRSNILGIGRHSALLRPAAMQFAADRGNRIADLFDGRDQPVARDIQPLSPPIGRGRICEIDRGARALFGHLSAWWILYGAAAALVLLAAAAAFWNVGLRSYSSASS